MKRIILFFILIPSIFAVESVDDLIKQNNDLERKIKANKALIKKIIEQESKVDLGSVSNNDIKVDKEKNSLTVNTMFTVSLAGANRFESSQQDLNLDINRYGVNFNQALELSLAKSVYNNFWMGFSYIRGSYTINDSLMGDQFSEVFNVYQTRLLYDFKLNSFNIHFMPYVGGQFISGLKNIGIDKDVIFDSETIFQFSAGIEAYSLLNSGFLIKLSLGTDRTSAGLGYAF